jgi:hypothetical protein
MMGPIHGVAVELCDPSSRRTQDRHQPRDSPPLVMGTGKLLLTSGKSKERTKTIQ